MSVSVATSGNLKSIVLGFKTKSINGECSRYLKDLNRRRCDTKEVIILKLRTLFNLTPLVHLFTNTFIVNFVWGASGNFCATKNTCNIKISIQMSNCISLIYKTLKNEVLII